MPHSLSFLVAVIVTWVLASGSGHAQDASQTALPSPASWRIELDQHQVRISDGQLPVLVYQRSTVSRDGKWPRADYVHPLYDLDGNVITEDFPPDHPHHRGVFWAWHQVLLDGKPQGDPWLCDAFQWDVRRTSADATPQMARLKSTVVWKHPAAEEGGGSQRLQQGNSEQKPQRLVRERVEVRTYPVHGSDSEAYRCVDFRIALRAIRSGVAIGGSDDVKGYGGFSPRIQLHPEVRFHGPEGMIEPRNTAIEAGLWVNIVWPDGGLLMVSHQDNPGNPRRWILRRTGSMQNAVFPGREPFSLSTDQPLVLRYRLVIHRGGLPSAQLQRIADEFQSLPY